MVNEQWLRFDFFEEEKKNFARIFFYGCVRQNQRFSLSLARVDRQRGRLLSPLSADLAEILRGKQARVWLWMMQILLGHVEVRGASVEKPSKTDDFRRFWPGLTDAKIVGF